MEYHDFLSETFCLTVPKKIVQEPFIVSLILVCKNFFCIRGVGHDFLPEYLVAQCRKKLYMYLMCFTDFGYRKFLCIRGVGLDFFSDLFVSQCRKKMKRNILVFHLISGMEKIYA